MLIRANTARNILPQRQDELIRHHQKLKQRTREIFSKQSSRSTERKISTAIFTATSRTNKLFKPYSQQQYYRDRPSALTVRHQQNFLRPLTQQSRPCRRSHSPLSVIKTRSKAYSNDSTRLGDQPTTQRKKFLKRGQSIDKAIIQNVLKSKLNQNVCAPTFYYCDQPQNKHLLQIIAKQIPKGVKDVVGIQEMMRMSHIFTGAQFRNSSLTKKLNATLTVAKKKRKTSHAGDQEDNLTLKSIKRW